MHNKTSTPGVTRLLPLSWLREAGAGLIVACVSLPACISAGVLVYSALGSQFVPAGALAGLFCAVVGGMVAALVRRSSFIVTIPTTAPMALVQASSTAAVVVALQGDANLALLVLPILVLMAGAWEIVFAVTGLSRVVKFAPYPVIAGFVTGIGLLIIINQVPVIFDERSLSALVQDLVSLRLVNPASLAYGAFLIAVMIWLGRAVPRIPNLLAGLVIGSALFHAARVLLPGLELGPVIGKISIHSIWSWPPVEPEAVRAVSSFGVLRIVL
ncbi:MAG: SulP family inorganic anion transporter, partial [Pseudolabrys sp.]|nr:SulP family inorganic anion transporter [Pseudolabrys sp.]